MLYDVTPKILRPNLKHHIVIPEKELEFFDLVNRYIRKYEVDFDQLRYARKKIDERMPELENYGVATEAATRLKERGTLGGVFYGSFVGKFRGTYKGEAKGTLSSLSSLELKWKDQAEYMDLLGETIERANEHLSKSTNFPLRIGAEDELNRVLGLINHNISVGNSLNVGMVNEINRRLDDYSRALGPINNLENIVWHEAPPSPIKKGERPEYNLLRKYFNMKVFPNNRGAIVTGGKWILATEAIMTTLQILSGEPLSSPENFVLFGTGLMSIMLGTTATFIAMDTYHTIRPYEKLQQRLDGPKGSIGEYTEDLIRSVMRY